MVVGCGWQRSNIRGICGGARKNGLCDLRSSSLIRLREVSRSRRDWWLDCLQVCVWLDSLYLRVCVCLWPCVCVPMCVFFAADDSRHTVLSAGRKRGEGGCLLFQQVAIATLRSGAAIISVITTQFWQSPSSLPLWRPPMRDKLSDLYVSWDSWGGSSKLWYDEVF